MGHEPTKKRDNDKDKVNDKDKFVTCDIWDTDYNWDIWEPEFMIIFVTWQLRVTLDSIRNSCDVLSPIQEKCDILKLSSGFYTVTQVLDDFWPLLTRIYPQDPWFFATLVLDELSSA